MVVVTGTGPDVANLLGLDVLGLKEGTVKRRRGDLQNGQRRRQVHQGLRHAGNGRNQRRQADAQRRALADRGGRGGGSLGHQLAGQDEGNAREDHGWWRRAAGAGMSRLERELKRLRCDWM